MDTEAFIPDISLIDKVNVVSGTREELKEIFDFIELSRMLQEIYQWYQIFKFNLQSLKSVTLANDFISVNSYTIALLSNGKNLLEEIDLCMKNSYGKESSEYKQYIENTQKEYEKSFPYRFLFHMRNFSQHGHIPVSTRDTRPCFDLTQIYETPYFKLNATVKAEVKMFIDDFRENNHDVFKLAFEPTVCAYTLSIFKLYNTFCDMIYPALIKYYEYVKKMVEKYPEMVKHENDPEKNGFLFIDNNEDPTIHCFNVNDDPIVLFLKWKNDGVVTYKKECKLMKEMSKAFREL